MKTKKHPLISVIIPTLNEEKALPMCLESLKDQRTNFPYEVIVVDFKSTDKTVEIARKMGARVVNIDLPGRAAARQRGAEAARGEILAFTEADCVVNTNWIEEIGSYLKENLQVIGLTGIYSFYDSTAVLNLLAKIILNSNEFFYHLVFGNHSFRGTNMIIRKKILKAAGGYNQQAAPCDDVDLGMRVRKIGPIHFLRQLKIKTSDRRVRGRVLTFLKEFFSTYFRVFILKRRGIDESFAIIR